MLAVVSLSSVDGRLRLLDEPFEARRAESVVGHCCLRHWFERLMRVTVGPARLRKRVSSAGGDPGLVSVREAADQLGVHPETIRRLIHDGRLDAVRVGRVLRVHREAVDSFLARQRVKPTRFQA